MRLFGSSGIRSLADRGLFSLAFKVGLSVGKLYPSVVVGQDTRTSSDALNRSMISGLLAAGASVTDIGVAPTPTLAYIAREYQAGVMITASHNPPEYNGIKLWNPDGSAFSLDQQRRVEEMIATDSLAVADWTEFKSGSERHDAIRLHSQRILRDFPDKLKVRVVVDCACGAASVITPYLLRELGGEVIAINSHPGGFFPHPVEPVEANLEVLMEATKRFGAAVGIAHDGDADRMMAVDEGGRFIPGDKLFIILAKLVGARQVMTTVDTSMAVEDAGFETRRTRVGDSFVSEGLKEWGGDFGGEPSGAWIFPAISYCPDGIYAAARIAAAAGQAKLSDLVDSIKSYPVIRGSVGTDGLNINHIESALMAMKPESVSRIDGLRLAFKDGWLLVRPSGTEPKIRLTAEARTSAAVRDLYQKGLSLIEGCNREGRQVT